MTRCRPGPGGGAAAMAPATAARLTEELRAARLLEARRESAGCATGPYSRRAVFLSRSPAHAAAGTGQQARNNRIRREGGKGWGGQGAFIFSALEELKR